MTTHPDQPPNTRYVCVQCGAQLELSKTDDAVWQLACPTHGIIGYSTKPDSDTWAHGTVVDHS